MKTIQDHLRRLFPTPAGREQPARPSMAEVEDALLEAVGDAQRTVLENLVLAARSQCPTCSGRGWVARADFVLTTDSSGDLVDAECAGAHSEACGTCGPMEVAMRAVVHP